MQWTYQLFIRLGDTAKRDQSHTTFTVLQESSYHPHESAAGHVKQVNENTYRAGLSRESQDVAAATSSYQTLHYCQGARSTEDQSRQSIRPMHSNGAAQH
jgi:hypothetical protein